MSVPRNHLRTRLREDLLRIERVDDEVLKTTGRRVHDEVCFFFSSRRRHTRSDRDWSSDVCSSDLRETKSLQLYHHILWLSREGLVMVEQYVLPMVGSYLELKVLAYKLRASFYHIFVDRKSTRLNSSHDQISYAVFCLKKKKTSRYRRADRPEAGARSLQESWLDAVVRAIAIGRC